MTAPGGEQPFFRTETMRKDYMAVEAECDDETDFIEKYWTDVWEREGGPAGRIDKIAGKEEYRLMAPYLAKLPKGARILDGGCGLGDWVMALDREGFSAVGLDLSRKTIEKLKALFPAAEFAAGDIRDTGFADASFDAYFSWGVFEHFEAGPQACIDEALRILKPGGWLFITVPHDNMRHGILASRAKPKPAKGNERFYQYRFTRAELGNELSMAGFDLVDFHPIHKRQGVLRSLHHEFGLPYGWTLTKGLSVLLAPFIPGSLISHMVFAVARKPIQPNA